MKNKKFAFIKGHALCLTCILLFILIFISSLPCAAGELYNKKGDGLKAHNVSNIDFNENYVWFSAGIAGVMSFDKQSEEFKLYTKKDDAIIGDSYAVLNAFGKMWVGTSGGLNVVDAEGNITAIKEIEVPSKSKPGEMVVKNLRESRSLWFEDGYMWLCVYTVNGGLFKYDGKYWEELKFGMSTFNYVTDIQVVDDDYWFGTAGLGVYIYSTVTKKWTVINANSKDKVALPSNSIKHVKLVGKKMWVVAGNDICIIERKGDEFSLTKIKPTIDGKELSISSITRMLVTKEDAEEPIYSIYLGTIGGGVIKYSDGIWEQVELTDENNEAVIYSAVSALGVDGDTLWVGTNKGIIKTEL